MQVSVVRSGDQPQLGFDVPLGNIVLARKVKETVQSVADFHGKDAVFVATNLKGFTDREANWGLVAVGPALAGVGLVLQDHFDTMRIPSSHSYRQMFPWGSHVMLDHHWSSDRLTMIHDGADASRIDKTLAISTAPSAAMMRASTAAVPRRPHSITRPSRTDSVMPRTTPMAARRTVCDTVSRTTSALVAPSAIRTPISCARCATM